MAAKTSDWRPGPTVCRCCLSEGCYKDISTEYFWMGKREVYSEMLSETFDLSISYSKSGGPNSQSRLICEPCIARLRDAADFKRQVQECEKTFMSCLDPVTALSDLQAVLELDKEVKVEMVMKEEKRHSDDDFDDAPDFGDDDDYDDLDDQPLTKLASKIPKKEAVDVLDLLDNAKITAKRKSSSKIKSQSSKKSKSKQIATSSKEKPEPKKKKVTQPASSIQKAKRNAELVLEHSTAYPFRVRGKDNMLCVYCHEEYTNPNDYRAHMDECHESFTVSTAFAHCSSGKEYIKVDLTNLKCRLCSTPCDSLDEIAAHIRDSHGFSQMNTDFDIGMHPYRLSADKWICALCDKKFASLVQLCRHTTSHYRRYTCDVCGRMYLTNEALKHHTRCNHSGSHVCRKCWSHYPTLEMKREHIKMSKPCWPFCCVTCGDRFISWEKKQEHLMKVHGRAKKVYECPDCDQTFNSRKPFYNHFSLVHSGNSYKCPCCHIKFSTKKQMEEHRFCHTGEKPFRCDECSKTFSRKKNLLQHMWIHSDNKRFACVICKKQFAQKVSLTGHMKSHHPEITL
ncbi:zinc finger protein 879-like isoform X14 [Maniola hyperantus]|uniref:zinc finger protein 879-like isoform X14 n=1 Tax=Aphantopus hyperantus TaxID=2795564 RepID=UPI00156A3DF7|nr:gastrula zinc finger protein XlCGF57.1-like isoform X6 [Maniola hyperantus]